MRRHPKFGAEPQPEIIPPLDLNTAPPNSGGIPWLLIIAVAGIAYWYFYGSKKTKPEKLKSEPTEVDEIVEDDGAPEIREFTLLREKKRAT